MSDFKTKIDVDTSKVVLSSESMTRKTEKFLTQTKYILSVDFFVSKIAEAVLLNFDRIFRNVEKSEYLKEENCFKIETTDKAFAFLVKFGFQIENQNDKDIVFFSFLGAGDDIRQNDTRIKNYLAKNKVFSVWISPTLSLNESVNLNKLYRLSNGHNINFPFLSKEQLEIVTTEDENVVVQGVAGSGKTNVCIEKIIWSASKNYGGKVLYTTFSRGLLNDTKLKVESFKDSLIEFVDHFEKGNIIFLGNDKKKALENYLGIFLFTDEDDVLQKLKRIIFYIENKVDYLLIEDIYRKYFEEKLFSDEDFFVKNYLNNIKNHQIAGKLSKIKNVSNEIIYKEIFGLIFGSFKDDFSKTLSEKEYVELRKDSFSAYECETIYQIALDYQKFLKEKNMLDNNLACRQMLGQLSKIPRYSIVVLDEVQDFTQIALVLFKNITLKMFCAGDALQMINPSYFSFGYLKNLLFEKDVINVSELKNNYRNANEIQEIIDGLEQINIKTFGVHNFISQCKGVENDIKAEIVYCNSSAFVGELAKNKYDSFTVVVPTLEKKNKLRQILKNQEVLTVSEIKGLERDTVLLYNILSDNDQKWTSLERMKVNRKQADENSVYRYYFNMFYVGVSRARQNLFVVENKNIKTMRSLFEKYFDCLDVKGTIKSLNKIVSKIEYTQSEYLHRVDEFLKHQQYENASFAADKIVDDLVRTQEFIKIGIYKNYVHFGKYREAGIKFWESGQIEEAKKQFTLSGDKILIELIDAVSKNNQTNLSYEIVKYFNDVKENDIARQFILEILRNDLESLKQEQKDTKEKLKNFRGNKNG